MENKATLFLQMMHDFIESHDMKPSEFMGATCFAICNVAVRLGYDKQSVIDRIAITYDREVGIDD